MINLCFVCLLQLYTGVLLLLVPSVYGQDGVTWDEQFNFWRSGVWRRYTSLLQLSLFDNATCYQHVDTYFTALDNYQGWAVQGNLKLDIFSNKKLLHASRTL